MKYAKKLGFLLLLSLFIFIFCTGCQSSDEKQVKAAITTELNLLKKIDITTIENYISYQDLFPSMDTTQPISPEIAEIFPLFFHNYSFKIWDVSIDGKKATAMIRIKSIDAHALAKDYSKAIIQKRIASSANPENVEYSLEDYYLLLNNLLKNNSYKMLENNCEITLEKKKNTWKILHSTQTDNQLVGGFASYLADANLFTPSEIVAIHFDTLKEFDTEQLNRYLAIDSLFSTDDSYNRSITQSLTSQIHDHFDYKILDETDDGRTAAITADITSCDFKTIVATYKAALDQYLSTSQSLADGPEGRLKTASQLLLDSIRANTTSSTSRISLTLINDGSSWKLQVNQELAQAILGGIGDAIAEITIDVE